METLYQLRDGSRGSHENTVHKREGDHYVGSHKNNSLSNTTYNIRVDNKNSSNSSLKSDRKSQHHDPTKHGTTKFPDIALRPGHAVEHTSDSPGSNSSNDLRKTGINTKHQPPSETRIRKLKDKENYSKQTGITTNNLTVKAPYDSSHKQTINKHVDYFRKNEFEKSDNKITASKERAGDDTNTNRNKQSKLKQNIPKVKPGNSTSPGDDNKQAGEARTTGKHVTDKKRFHLGPPTRLKLELCQFVNRDVIGGDEVCHLRFGPTKTTYLDYVASGRPLRCIENYIRRHVMPFYANTHTEVSYYAAQTNKLREEARDIIKESVHATEDDAVIFCGSGSTSAIHKLIHAMDLKNRHYHLSPIVFLGPYEHHSNILPWLEMKAKVIHIKQKSNETIDLDHLEQELQETENEPERTLIGSFSAASNVTGILTDTVALANLMHRYKGFCFFDYACAGPYVEIDMNCSDKGPLAYKDGIFLSTHKFLGGPQTPGILVAKKWVFKNEVPHGVGGGTVVFVRRQRHRYHAEPEHREEGGTPAIIETIRAGLVFKLKETFTSQFIMEREAALFGRAKAAWRPNPNLIILGNLTVDRLPIFPMLFYNRQTGRLLHHDFVAMLLNDLFGLQVRSGCACAALYGLELMGMSEETAKRYEALITEFKMDKRSLEDFTSHGCCGNGAHVDNVIFKPGFVRLNLPFILILRPGFVRLNLPFILILRPGFVRLNLPFILILRPGFVRLNLPFILILRPGFVRLNLPFILILRPGLRPGFVRLNLPFIVTDSCVDFVIKAIQMTADDGWRLLPMYDFDRQSGRWWYRHNKDFEPPNTLQDVEFSRGFCDIRSPRDSIPSTPLSVDNSDRLSLQYDFLPGTDYDEILDRAKFLFERASQPGVFDLPDQTPEFTGEAEELRWFMLPSEAADVINQREVVRLDLDDLPFVPPALAEKFEGHDRADKKQVYV
ncbi:uncharacterized protein LOC131938549 [Physella acuta]|uniref:uncharacterized protein LOC131938549 n=1 Tax=Physella acuta TaxID=109671 RepID=UPI0027DD4500|nr:uncharacterized protein LOC131938549 [Physella acuta]